MATKNALTWNSPYLRNWTESDILSLAMPERKYILSHGDEVAWDAVALEGGLMRTASAVIATLAASIGKTLKSFVEKDPLEEKFLASLKNSKGNPNSIEEYKNAEKLLKFSKSKLAGNAQAIKLVSEIDLYPSLLKKHKAVFAEAGAKNYTAIKALYEQIVKEFVVTTTVLASFLAKERKEKVSVEDVRRFLKLDLNVIESFKKQNIDKHISEAAHEYRRSRVGTEGGVASALDEFAKAAKANVPGAVGAVFPYILGVGAVFVLLYFSKWLIIIYKCLRNRFSDWLKVQADLVDLAAKDRRSSPEQAIVLKDKAERIRAFADKVAVSIDDADDEAEDEMKDLDGEIRKTRVEESRREEPEEDIGYQRPADVMGLNF